MGATTAAVPHAKVLLQLHKAVRPGKSEVSSRWVSQFRTPAKKGGSETSRFSKVVSVRLSGRYRAFVRVPIGSGLFSGASSSVVLHAATHHAGPDFIQQASLYNIEKFFGWVSSTDEFRAALQANINPMLTKGDS